MHPKWVFKHFATVLQGSTLRLAVLWSLSLLCGILLCSLASSDLSIVFRTAFSAQTSILERALVCLLPLVVIVTGLSYATVFLCGISQGFCGFAIYIAQGNAAWLLRPLLLFSAVCSSVVMWWLIFQSNATGRFRERIRFALILCCIICCIDFFIISPFVGDLSKYF